MHRMKRGPAPTLGQRGREDGQLKRTGMGMCLTSTCICLAGVCACRGGGGACLWTFMLACVGVKMHVGVGICRRLAWD